MKDVLPVTHDMILTHDPAVLKDLTVTVFLLVQSAADIRTRKILLLPAVLFALAGLMMPVFLPSENSLAAFLEGTALALLPGLFLFAASRLTRGGIGMGDAVCLLALAPFVPLSDLCVLLLCAVALSAAFAAVLLIRKKGRHYAYPFIPFLALSAVLRIIVHHMV